jgi:hypothetical protein
VCLLLPGGDGDSFVVEDRYEFKSTAHALDNGTHCGEQVVVCCLHRRDRCLRSLEPFSKLDLGELTVSAEFGKVERDGVGTGVVFDGINTATSFGVDVSNDVIEFSVSHVLVSFH